MKDLYRLDVCNRLLIKLRMNGIDPTEAIVFFGSQAQQMLGFKPNYGPQSARNKPNNPHYIPRDIWLLRGFYPETAQMFKITVSECNESCTFKYIVKITEPTIRNYGYGKAKNASRTSIVAYNSKFYSKELDEPIRDRLEKEVLGGDLKLSPLVSDAIIYTPRCISPKGMKLFNLKIKKE